MKTKVSSLPQLTEDVSHAHSFYAAVRACTLPMHQATVAVDPQWSLKVKLDPQPAPDSLCA